MKDQKVSIVLCTYNGEKYLEQQLDSILDQTYPIHELLIQDDCSTDSTVQILERYKQKNPVIKYSINKKQLGLNENFFSAMRNATGDFIAVSDQDDIWEPDKIEREMETIGDKLLCFCFSKAFSENIIFPFDDSIPNYNLIRLIFVNVVSGHTILLRKELLDLVPYYDDMICYDYWLSLTASAHKSIIFCDKILCHFRRHEGALTYGIPLSSKKTLSNGSQLLLSALKKRSRMKGRANEHYSTLYHFLDMTDLETTEVRDAKKLCKLLAKQGFFSTLHASFLCVMKRDIVFHKKDPNDLRAIARAICHPFLCYHYIDY